MGSYSRAEEIEAQRQKNVVQSKRERVSRGVRRVNEVDGCALKEVHIEGAGRGSLVEKRETIRTIQYDNMKKVF